MRGIFNHRYNAKHMIIKPTTMFGFGYYKEITERKFNYLTLGRTAHYHILILCFLITINKEI